MKCLKRSEIGCNNIKACRMKLEPPPPCASLFEDKHQCLSSMDARPYVEVAGFKVGDAKGSTVPILMWISARQGTSPVFGVAEGPWPSPKESSVLKQTLAQELPLQQRQRLRAL